MTTPARLRLLRLIAAAVALALPIGCSSDDEARRHDSAASAEAFDEGDAASDEEAEFEAEAPPAPPPGADALLSGGAEDDDGETAKMRRKAAPDNAAPQTAGEPASESEDGGGGLLGLLSIFGDDEEPQAERRPKKTKDARKSGAGARRAGPRKAAPYPWVSTRAATRVMVQPTPRTGSWGLTTALMREGVRPLPERVRPQDFLNAPSYGYPGVEGAAWGRVEVDLAPSPSGVELLRVGLVTRSTSDKPVDVTFVVDATKRTPAEAIDAWRDLTAQACESLRPDDRLSVVTVTDTVGQVSDAAPAAPFASVPPYPEGTTMLELGLAAALQSMAVTARDAHRAVVVFASTVPVNEMGLLRKRVRLLQQQGVHVSFVSSVSARHPDADLLSLARDGGGQHIFVDERQAGPAPAQVRALSASLSPAFVDADLVFRFDGAALASYRLIGYQRRMSAGAGRDVAVALGREQEVTFLFEVVRRGAASHDGATLGTLSLRSPSHSGGPLPLIARGHASLDDAPSSMKRAVVAASVAEWLRDADPIIAERERWLALAGDDDDLAPVLDAAKAWMP